MNFQAVRNAKGQKDDKGYAVKVGMMGVFAEVGGATLTQSQKQTCVCSVIDDMGEKHRVHFYGTLPTPAVLNKRQSMSLSAFDGQGQAGSYIGYSGFWNFTAQVNQPTPTMPQQGPQQQQAAQQPNANEGYINAQKQQEARKTSIERQSTFKSACIRAASTDMSPEDIIELALAGQHFVEFGDNPYGLPNRPVDEPQGEDESLDFP